MHSQLGTPDGLVLMGADTPAGMDYRPQAGSPSPSTVTTWRKLRGYRTSWMVNVEQSA